jgi:hypothetical protein
MRTAAGDARIAGVKRGPSPPPTREGGRPQSGFDEGRAWCKRPLGRSNHQYHVRSQPGADARPPGESVPARAFWVTSWGCAPSSGISKTVQRGSVPWSPGPPPASFWARGAGAPTAGFPGRPAAAGRVGRSAGRASSGHPPCPASRACPTASRTSPTTRPRPTEPITPERRAVRPGSEAFRRAPRRAHVRHAVAALGWNPGPAAVTATWRRPVAPPAVSTRPGRQRARGGASRA